MLRGQEPQMTQMTNSIVAHPGYSFEKMNLAKSAEDAEGDNKTVINQNEKGASWRSWRLGETWCSGCPNS